MNEHTARSIRKTDVRPVLSGVRLDTPQDVAGGLLAFIIFCQITALGANDQVIGAIASTVNILTGLVVLNWLRVDRAYWRMTVWVFLLFGAGLLWACLPSFAAVYDIQFSLLGGEAPRPAPDLQSGGAIRYVGQMSMVLAAAVIGYRRASVRSFVNWLLIFGSANLLIGGVLWALDPTSVWGAAKIMHEDRYTGTFQNANVEGALSAFLNIVALGRILSISTDGGGAAHLREMRGWLLFYGSVFALSLAALVLTSSRTSLALTVLACGILLARFSAVRRLGLVARILVVVAAVIAAGLAWYVGEMIGVGAVVRLHGLVADGAYRGEIYARYWGLARGSSLFGYGLSSFSELNVTTLTSASQARAFGYIQAAHNQPLQLLLAGGWPFLFFNVLAAAALCRRAWEKGTPADAAKYSLWLGLFVILGCSMTDIVLTVPSILSLTASIAGILWGRAIRLRLDAIIEASRTKSYYSRRKKIGETAPATVGH